MSEARQVFRSYDDADDVSATPWVAYCGQCGDSLAPDAVTGGMAACDSCGHRHYRNPAPAVSVLVSEGERVVLCRRARTAFRGGKWCLPCGFIDYDEDFLSAARREVLEETGLGVEITSILSVVTNYHEVNVHSLVIVLEASVTGGDLAAGDDVDRAEWFDPAALPELAFEADEHIIARYVSQSRFGAPVDLRYARGR